MPKKKTDCSAPLNPAISITPPPKRKIRSIFDHENNHSNWSDQGIKTYIGSSGDCVEYVGVMPETGRLYSCGRKILPKQPHE